MQSEVGTSFKESCKQRLRYCFLSCLHDDWASSGHPIFLWDSNTSVQMCCYYFPKALQWKKDKACEEVIVRLLSWILGIGIWLYVNLCNLPAMAYHQVFTLPDRHLGGGTIYWLSLVLVEFKSQFCSFLCNIGYVISSLWVMVAYLKYLS